MPARPDPKLTTRVLEAARVLEARRGDGWNMAELAREAGIARASVLRRFTSPDEVRAALARPPDQDAPPSLRARVLDAFLAVARRKGLAATTLEDVAAEAGIGVASVYRHFGGRAGMIAAYADERTPRAQLSLLRPANRAPAPEVLQAVARAMIEHLVTDGPLLFLAPPADPEGQRMLGHLRELEARSRAELRRWFARATARGELHGDAATLTNAFVGMVAGSVLLAASTKFEPGPLAARLVALFLRGCERRPAPGPRKSGE